VAALHSARASHINAFLLDDAFIAERKLMLVPELIAGRERPLFSFELIPPRRGGGMGHVHAVIEALKPFDPAWVDVTNHAADSWFEEREDGSWHRHILRKRPGTLGLCAAIKYRYGIETVPHLLCVGFTREETEDALIELSYLEIHNVLVIRGDQTDWKDLRPGTRNEYALDLVNQIRAMNEGRFLHDMAERSPTHFSVGVAGYPEKHIEAPNLQYDVSWLKAKVDAGADWVVTQMCFTAETWLAYERRCREAGIKVPVIPGIKLLSRQHQLASLPRHFQVDLPEDLVSEFMAAKTREAREEVGIRHAVEECRKLLDGGAPGLHFFVTQDAELVAKVMKRVGA
jgi:methylenetetrahydrofolate reductase (NADPH)